MVFIAKLLLQTVNFKLGIEEEKTIIGNWDYVSKFKIGYKWQG